MLGAIKKHRQQKIKKTQKRLKRLVNERIRLCRAEGLTPEQFVGLFELQNLKFEDLPDTPRMQKIRLLTEQIDTLDKYLGQLAPDLKEYVQKLSSRMTEEEKIQNALRGYEQGGIQ